MRPELHDAPRPIDLDLLAAYLSTEVVDADGAVWSGAGAIALDDEVWVVTAENPFSEKQDDAVNAAYRIQEVAAELRESLRAERDRILERKGALTDAASTPQRLAAASTSMARAADTGGSTCQMRPCCLAPGG